MDPMIRGLRFRIQRAARKMAEQHQHIHGILRDFDHALADADLPRLGEIFESYRSALEAHFSLEEEVFFPGLHGLQPQHSAELDALSEDHATFAAELERLADALGQQPLARFERGFRELVGDLAQHERQEERIVRRLSEGEGHDQEGGPGSASPSRSGVESSS
jgi:hypothetical protein